mmetsp:Transcript_44693/g.105190  ORF Transcript_44693/g.105190 Transcript_44693/m.105190 type:complete len:232 (+) Transcript_44693:704-1399(+)
MCQPARELCDAQLSRRCRARAGQAPWPEGRGAGPQGHREARHGQLPGRGPGFGGAAAFHRGPLRRCGQVGRAGGAGRQGHHLRHRRHFAEAGRRDGRDEVRHGWRGRRHRHAARGGRTQAQAQPGDDRRRLRKHAERPRGQAGRCGHVDVRPDHRDPEHRCRRPADPVRRADLCRALQARRRRRRGDADRGLRDRAGRRAQRHVCQRRRTRRLAERGRRGRAGPLLAPAAG